MTLGVNDKVCTLRHRSGGDGGRHRIGWPSHVLLLRLCSSRYFSYSVPQVVDNVNTWIAGNSVTSKNDRDDLITLTVCTS